MKRLFETDLSMMDKKFHPVIDALQHWGQEYIEYLKANDID